MISNHPTTEAAALRVPINHSAHSMEITVCCNLNTFLVIIETNHWGMIQLLCPSVLLHANHRPVSRNINIHFDLQQSHVSNSAINLSSCGYAGRGLHFQFEHITRATVTSSLYCIYALPNHIAFCVAFHTISCVAMWTWLARLMIVFAFEQYPHQPWEPRQDAGGNPGFLHRQRR